MGHRGCGGIAQENSEIAIKKAIKIGVDVIEIDIRKTKDNQLVLCHDDNLARIANRPVKISDATLKELQAIRLNDGSRLLSLREALKIVGSTPVMIDDKEVGSARVLLKILREFPKVKASIASFKLKELMLLRELDKNIMLYGLSQTKPFDILHYAKMFDLNGVGLNHWLLNPLTYMRARFSKLDIYVYTVNRRFTVWFIRLLYPNVTICTNYPNRFLIKKVDSKG